MIKPEDADTKWHLVDATDQTLGRLASRIAALLRGKHNPAFTPHWDMGDHVVVVNAEKVHLTGRKWAQKRYASHSRYPGGLTLTQARQLHARHPERLIELAVRGMLPKNRLGRKINKKLKVYAGAEHPHVAQAPQPLTME